MSDNYIDQNETLGYGEFTLKQIPTTVIGLEPPFDDALTELVTRLTKATKTMATVLKKTGEVSVTTFTGSAAVGHDPVAEARDLLGKLVKYVASREGGETMALEILGGERLTTVKRRRPAKLVHALDVALRALDKHKGALDEHTKWRPLLTKVRGEIDDLDRKVRESRSERRKMTPEVAAARDRWLKVYQATKLIVEGVLLLHGATDRMPDIFDDLAEVHRVAGVTDDDAAPADPEPAPK